MPMEMLHACPPPQDELKERFEESASVCGDFGHTLLVQKNADDGTLASSLLSYFESAHLDARDVFHSDIGLDLHPDAAGGDPLITYPGSLPASTRRGLFGEVLAGLLTETYTFVGQHNWHVPIFLFRYHKDAFHYLFTLVRDPDQVRQTRGREGSDFIGLCLDDERQVIRIISGEAKWRKVLTQGLVNTLMLGKWIKDGEGHPVRSGEGVWSRINKEPVTPSGVRQLQRLLQEHDSVGYDRTILSLERALVVRNPELISKTDLIVIAGNARANRRDGECLLPFEELPEEYTAGNDLQIVEVIFNGGEELIDAIYDNLWKGGENA